MQVPRYNAPAPLSIPSPPNPAQQLVSALKDEQREIEFKAQGDVAKLPIWLLHLPSGDVFQIRRIGVRGRLARFSGFGETVTETDIALVVPESVVITITNLPADEKKPHPIGFDAWPEDDVDGTEPEPGSTVV
jgi:hypothetical protein